MSFPFVLSLIFLNLSTYFYKLFLLVINHITPVHTFCHSTVNINSFKVFDNFKNKKHEKISASHIKTLLNNTSVQNRTVRVFRSSSERNSQKSSFYEIERYLWRRHHRNVGFQIKFSNKTEAYESYFIRNNIIAIN